MHARGITAPGGVGPAHGGAAVGEGFALALFNATCNVLQSQAESKEPFTAGKLPLLHARK